MTSELFIVSHCVYLVLQKPKEQNPCSKGLKTHSVEMSQGYFHTFKEGLANCTVFSPLHVHRVFLIVFIVFNERAAKLCSGST